MLLQMLLSMLLQYKSCCTCQCCCNCIDNYSATAILIPAVVEVYKSDAVAVFYVAASADVVAVINQ